MHICVTNFLSLLLERVYKALCQHAKVDEDLCYQLRDLQKVLFVSSREKKRIKMAIFYLLPVGRRTHGPEPSNCLFYCPQNDVLVHRVRQIDKNSPSIQRRSISHPALRRFTPVILFCSSVVTGEGIFLIGYTKFVISG